MIKSSNLGNGTGSNNKTKRGYRRITHIVTDKEFNRISSPVFFLDPPNTSKILTPKENMPIQCKIQIDNPLNNANSVASPNTIPPQLISYIPKDHPIQNTLKLVAQIVSPSPSVLQVNTTTNNTVISANTPAPFDLLKLPDPQQTQPTPSQITNGDIPTVNTVAKNNNNVPSVSITGEPATNTYNQLSIKSPTQVGVGKVDHFDVFGKVKLIKTDNVLHIKLKVSDNNTGNLQDSLGFPNPRVNPSDSIFNLLDGINVVVGQTAMFADGMSLSDNIQVVAIESQHLAIFLTDSIIALSDNINIQAIQIIPQTLTISDSINFWQDTLTSSGTVGAGIVVANDTLGSPGVSSLSSVQMPVNYGGYSANWNGPIVGLAFSPVNQYAYFISETFDNANNRIDIISQIDRNTMTRISDIPVPLSTTAQNQFVNGLAVDSDGYVWVISGVYDSSLGTYGQGNIIYKFDANLNLISYLQTASNYSWDVLDVPNVSLVCIDRVDGKYIAAAGGYSELFIWNRATVTLLVEVPSTDGTSLPGHGMGVNNICVDTVTGDIWVTYLNVISSSYQQLTKVTFTSGGAYTLTQFTNAINLGGNYTPTGQMWFSAADRSIVLPLPATSTGGGGGLAKFSCVSGTEVNSVVISYNGLNYAAYNGHAEFAGSRDGFGSKGTSQQVLTILSVPNPNPAGPTAENYSMKIVMFDYNLNVQDITSVLLNVDALTGVVTYNGAAGQSNNQPIPGQLYGDSNAGDYTDWYCDPNSNNLWISQPGPEFNVTTQPNITYWDRFILVNGGMLDTLSTLSLGQVTLNDNLTQSDSLSIIIVDLLPLTDSIYFFHDSTNTNVIASQVKIIINDTTIGDIVQELANDNFNRTNSSTLGSNWQLDTSGGGFSVNNNQAVASGNATNYAIWNNNVPADQWTQVTYDGSGNNNIQLILRWTDYSNYYLLNFASGQTLWYIRDNSGSTLLIGNLTRGFTTGDVIYFSVQGTTLSAYWNSTLLGQVNDSSHLSGRFGFFSDANGVFDDFSGGSLLSQADALAFLESSRINTGENIVLLDASAIGYGSFISDLMAQSDATQLYIVVTLQFTGDDLVLSDSISLVPGTPTLMSDSITSQSDVITLGPGIIVSDTNTLSDFTSIGFGFLYADTLSQTDIVSLFPGVPFLTNDTLSQSDVVVVGPGVTIGDTPNNFVEGLTNGYGLLSLDSLAQFDDIAISGAALELITISENMLFEADKLAISLIAAVLIIPDSSNNVWQMQTNDQGNIVLTEISSQIIPPPLALADTTRTYYWNLSLDASHNILIQQGGIYSGQIDAAVVTSIDGFFTYLLKISNTGQLMTVETPPITVGSAGDTMNMQDNFSIQLLG